MLLDQYVVLLKLQRLPPTDGGRLDGPSSRLDDPAPARRRQATGLETLCREHLPLATIEPRAALSAAAVTGVRSAGERLPGARSGKGAKVKGRGSRFRPVFRDFFGENA